MTCSKNSDCNSSMACGKGCKKNKNDCACGCTPGGVIKPPNGVPGVRTDGVSDLDLDNYG